MTADWIKEIPNWEKEYSSMEDVEKPKDKENFWEGLK